MKRVIWGVGLPALLLAAVAGATWTLMARESAPGDPLDDRQVAMGAALYSWNCARCHGEDLGGELGWVRDKKGLSDEDVSDIAKRIGDVAPAHDEHGTTSRLTDDVLFRVISEGTKDALNRPESRMSGFQDRLAEEEIWAIISFMKRTWRDAGVAVDGADRENGTN